MKIKTSKLTGHALGWANSIGNTLQARNIKKVQV